MITNVIIAGLGGQGVIKASDILAEAALRAGLDARKSEIHGMSQRGGSVYSDVRFGSAVLSPMVPAGEADYLVVLSEDQIACNRHHLRSGGRLLAPRDIESVGVSARSLNVALLSALSLELPIPTECWLAALESNLPERSHESNLAVFRQVRERMLKEHASQAPPSAGVSHDADIALKPATSPTLLKSRRSATSPPGPPHPVSAPDFMPLEHLRGLQLQRLRDVTQRAYRSVGLYRQRMQDRGIDPADLRSLDDIRRLPFTDKADLRSTYPFGLFARPMSEIVRLHASSGTTGKPIVVAYTQHDLDVWSSVMMRSFAACGLHAGDILQNAYGYGLFTGGLGAHYGAEALGATVVPASGGNTDRQLMLLKDFGVTAICCTPSYFLHLLDRAAELGIDMHDLPLRAGIFGAEPWTQAMREHIEADSGIRAYDIYGLSEIIGPGVGIECPCQAGLHIFEDHFLIEVIDPAGDEPVPDGREGELVITTLSKHAMPMLRYRTHDVTRIITEPCPCGRSIRRIQRIARRTDDMFIIRGVNVFPSQIETALLAVEGTLPHYQIILTREKGLDRIEVQVEVTSAVLSDTIGSMEAFRTHLAQSIERTINLRVEVTLVEPRSLQRSEGKARRVIDRRNIT